MYSKIIFLLLINFARSEDAVPMDPVPIPNVRKTPVQLNVKQNLMMNQVLSIYAIHNGNLNSVCKKHSEQFKEDLRAFQPWALKVFDSSSKIQSAVLGGNLMDFGGYDQCLAINEPTDSGVIRGQHCMVEIKPSLAITKIVLSYRNITLKQLDDLTGGNGIVLKWAICTPESCTAAEVEEHLIRAFEGISEGANINLTVRNESCVSKKSRWKLSRGDYATMIILGGITAVAFFSTMYDLHCRSTKYVPGELWIAFSMYSNTLRLIKPPKANQMNAMYGLRFLTMSWIICGHRYLTAMFFPMENTLDILDWMTKISSMVVVGGTFSVDTFFVISGVLLSYTFFKHMSETHNFNLIKFWIHRYVRLTPAYGFVSLFYATLLNHLGNGPLWTDLMYAVSTPCYTYWWSILLYLQNYVNPGDLCSVQTWYLQCDTQLYVLSPLLLLPLLKFPTFGLIQIMMLIVGSTVVAFKLAWKQQYRGGMPVTNALLKTDYFKYHYITTHTRASPWLMGVILGYIIFKTQDKKIRLSKMTSFLFWSVTITAMIACVFGAHPFQQPHRPYNRLEATLYLILSRIVWAFAISWILFACVTGYGGFVNTFLSANVFQVWGRLSYSMYLTHMIVQYTIGGRERVQTHFANELSVHLFFGDLIYTTFLGYIVTIYFESPILILERVLLGGDNKSKNSQIKPTV